VDDVRVHADSPVPAVLGAHAFTWGRHIHVGPGQQHHLPHEAWHAAQQLGGRVAATEARAGVALNADPRLEGEADRMGAAAVTGATADVCANRGAPAVAGGGPATHAPVMQGRLRLEGSLSDQFALLDRINATSSMPYYLDAEGFLSSVATAPFLTDEFSRQMEAAIEDRHQTVVLSLAHGMADPVDTFATGEVNIDNLLSMPDTVFQNWMIHVLAERFDVQNYESVKRLSPQAQYQAQQEHRKSTAELAHDVGHAAQERQLRELYPGLTIAFRGADPDVDESSRRVDAQGNGTIELRFDFTDVVLVELCPVVAEKPQRDQPLDWRIDVMKGAAP
jgi:hypothetical protein